MRNNFVAGVSIAVLLACVLFAPSANADTAFRAECVAPGDNDLFIVDPQTFSLPEERDAFSSYIQLCIDNQGHPRVQGAFFQ